MEVINPEPSNGPSFQQQEEHAGFYRALMEATPRVWITTLITAVNVAIFVWMVAKGVSAMDPTVEQLMEWGANYGPYTVHGEWWRLMTCAFVHIGLFHIALNMWCLWDAGHLAERLFGNEAFFTLYLLSALGGSIGSILWNPLVVSAGASGAVFGVYGGLLAFFVTRRGTIPKGVFNALVKSTIGFVGYNVIYGFMQSGIDNAAHLGGLAIGFAVGVCLSRPIPLLPNFSSPMRYARTTVVATLMVAAAIGAQARVNSVPDILHYGAEAQNAVKSYNRFVEAIKPIMHDQDAIEEETTKKSGERKGRLERTLSRLQAIATDNSEIASLKELLVQRTGRVIDAMSATDPDKQKKAMAEADRLLDRFDEERNAFTKKYGLMFK